MCPVGGGNPAFSGYVICSTYLRCFESETVCKGISTQNIVPVYQNRGRREGKARYLGLICPVLRWSETSVAFRWIRPWKSYLKHRKEAFQRKSDFSLRSFAKCPMWTDLPQEEKPWWALGVGIYFKGSGKQASEIIVIFLLFFLVFLVWHTFKSYYV